MWHNQSLLIVGRFLTADEPVKKQKGTPVPEPNNRRKGKVARRPKAVRDEPTK